MQDLVRDVDLPASPLHTLSKYTARAFALDPASGRIYVSGIGLDPAHYRRTKIAEPGIKRVDLLPSILAYDVALP